MNDTQKQFDTIRKLGSGAYGNVYEVETSSADKYAIKVYSDKLGGLAEFATLFSAADHPNIISLRKYTVDLDHKSVPNKGEMCDLALFMDLGHGDLRGIPSAELDLDRLYLDIAAALTYIHSRGIIHGDIKPENIIWDPTTKHYRLTDFSLAEFFTTHEVITNTVSTMQYRAPEVANHTNVGPGSDWFSLGMMLLELANKRRPYRIKKDDQVIAAANALYAKYPHLMSRDSPRPKKRRHNPSLFHLENNVAEKHMLHLLHEDPLRRFDINHYEAVRRRWVEANPNPVTPLADLTPTAGKSDGIFRCSTGGTKKEYFQSLLDRKISRRILWQMIFVIERLSVDDLAKLDLNVLEQIYDNIFYREHIKAPTSAVMDCLRLLRCGLVFRTPYECGYGRRVVFKDFIHRCITKIFFTPFRHL